MSLDALAPDQRAVVQLVLQQDRSYADLAGLLGISEAAVRERAHKGLAQLGPSSAGLDNGELAAVSDYLLGQQSVSERESTRAFLSSSPAARAWAHTVARELADVARSPLPGIPDGEPAREPREEPEPEPEPVTAAEPEPAPSPVRARPRPRERAASPAPTPARARTEASAPRSNRLGGALLIGGIAILIVAGIILLVSGGGDDNKSSSKTSTTASASPTATATPQFQPLGQINLQSPSGGNAKGQMVIFANSSGGVAFTIQGTGVPATGQGEAYAVWLVGGDKPHRLGFAPQVKSDGKFGTSGPRDQDAANFAKWFSQAEKVVVSKETSESATQPGPVVLEGAIPQGKGSSSGSSSGG